MEIFPSAYFGPINYYQQIVQENSVSFERFEFYIKQTLRNRMTILSPNGLQNLSIPVSKPNGNKTLMKDIEISYAENWQKIHWKAIESAYANAPYFEHYGCEVEALIFQQTKLLMDFNLNIHQRICQWLAFPMDFSFTEEHQVIDATIDHRVLHNEMQQTAEYSYVQVFSPNQQFEGNLSILDAIFNLGPMARNLFISSGK